jgi:nitrogen regulatory protein PII
VKRWILGLAALGLIVGGERQKATAGSITVSGATITVVEGDIGHLRFTVTNTGGDMVTFMGDSMYTITLKSGDSDDMVTKVTHEKTTGGPIIDPGNSITFDLLVETSATELIPEIPEDMPVSEWEVGVTVRFTAEAGPQTQTGSGTVFVPDVAPVPEPVTLTLVGIGIAGMAGYGYRRRKRQAPA